MMLPCIDQRSYENYNQIFCRDIAFCIEDKIIKANILPDREKEYAAMSHGTQSDCSREYY